MSGERDPNDVDIAICVCCRRNLPCRHCPDTPKSATGDDLSAPQPSEAPADGAGAERPAAANLGRIGWLNLPEWGQSFLVREVEEGWAGTSGDVPNEWFARENVPDATFAPLTPADFGWTVLGEGQVAVDRDDLGLALGYVPDPEGSWACRRLRAVLDGATNPYARIEADDDRN